jgi:hypothetical protein
LALWIFRGLLNLTFGFYLGGHTGGEGRPEVIVFASPSLRLETIGAGRT